MKRYKSRTGKWGVYFHDNERKIDMTIEDVENNLNDKNELIEALICAYKINPFAKWKHILEKHTGISIKELLLK